ncbi:MAG: M1 family aminopeptidase [Bacteroidia bacterium]|nr:M1 family aminopeptidase [Bacteroidia bacterium]
MHTPRRIPKRSATHMILTVVLLVACTSLPLRAQGTEDIDVLHYRAELRITPFAKTLEGSAEVTVRNAGATPLSVIPLDLVNMSVTGVSVHPVSVPHAYDGTVLSVELPDAVLPGDSVTLRISYNGTPGNEGGSQPWGGCHWGDISYFMGVGFRAASVSLMRYWLPSNDVPHDKARFDVTFTVPEGLVVAGTGVLAGRSDDAGWSSFRWVEQHPCATYLFTYAISDYVVIRDTWNGIPMEYYVRRADSLRGVSYFTTVAGMMEAFTHRFGPYPFDKVGYCLTPIGSMEHQTMISYADQLFRTESVAGRTAAHELAHMWWGDWVTCRDFGDAWLNEGFAVFSEMVYAEYFGGESKYLEAVKTASEYYRQSIVSFEGMLPLHDFPRTAPSSNYPYTIYQKGGMVLVMLRDVMGDDAFFEGLRDYGRRHAYGSASTEDFQSVMEEHHGSSLHWFFDQWVFKAGYPVYTVQRVLDPSGAPLRINLLQTQDTLKYPLFTMPMDVAILLQSGDTLRRRIETGASGYQEIVFTDIAARDVRHAILDPRGVVLKHVTYRTVTSIENPVTLPAGMAVDAVYPNPADASVTLKLRATSSTAVELLLHDTAGRLVHTWSGMAQSGTQSLLLDTSALTPGAYTLTIQSSSGMVSTGIMVAHRK